MVKQEKPKKEILLRWILQLYRKNPLLQQNVYRSIYEVIALTVKGNFGAG